MHEGGAGCAHSGWDAYLLASVDSDLIDSWCGWQLTASIWNDFKFGSSQPTFVMCLVRPTFQTRQGCSLVAHLPAYSAAAAAAAAAATECPLPRKRRSATTGPTFQGELSPCGHERLHCAQNGEKVGVVEGPIIPQIRELIFANAAPIEKE